MTALGRALLKVARIMLGLSLEERRTLVKEMARSLTTVVGNSNQSGGGPPHHGSEENAATVVGNLSDPTPSSFLSSSPVVPKDYPEELQEIRVFLRKISAPRVFDDPAYWIRIDAWLGGSNSGVGYLDELPAYLAWNDVQNGARKHRDLQRGFRNWLAKSEYWSQQRAQTQAIRRR